MSEETTIRNILIVYAGYPTRATLVDALFAFRRYAPARLFYLNVRLRRIPRYLRLVSFDVVIFHTLYFAARWEPVAFRRQLDETEMLAGLGAVRLAIPQDEFINSDGMQEFLERFRVDVVLSVQPEDEWDQLYGRDRAFAIHRVLTGYLDDARLARIAAFQGVPRHIDIGYRAADRPPAWFGRHGHLKADIATVVESAARARGLVTDISVEARDALPGDEWYRFLCRCRYTLGTEGGTSILDRTGELRRRTDAYAAAHPGAAFEEIEAACFPGLDGTFRGVAISPRHLEACAARVCQVLTEGAYNGVLEAGRHYLELKRDFSNLPEVLDRIESGEGREEMVERAYTDVVASGRFSTRAFVDLVLARASDHLSPHGSGGSRPVVEHLVYGWMRGLEWLDRAVMVLRARLPVWLRLRLRGRRNVAS